MRQKFIDIRIWKILIELKSMKKFIPHFIIHPCYNKCVINERPSMMQWGRCCEPIPENGRQSKLAVEPAVGGLFRKVFL